MISKKGGIFIDLGELANSLSSCDYVISEMSAVLYDDKSLECKILMVLSKVSRFVFGLTDADCMW